MRKVIRVGTRKSGLAMAQTDWVINRLQERHPLVLFETVPVVTKGDRIQDRPLAEFGGKGVFVSELERALLLGEIDLAVHSAKDLPAELAEGLTIAAVPVREDPADVLVMRPGSEGRPGDKDAPRFRIGTGSLRRRMFLEEFCRGGEWSRNGLLCTSIRGNVPTRLEKIITGEVDAVVLAAAGLKRLALWQEERFSYRRFDPDVFVPAGGQGILAVEGRDGDEKIDFVKDIEDAPSRLCLETERAVLRKLGAGCHTAVGVYARILPGEEKLLLRGACGEDGELRYALETTERAQWLTAAERAADSLRGK